MQRFATVIVAVFVALAMIAGVARTLFPTDLSVRGESLRAAMWKSAGLVDPDPEARRATVARFEARFSKHQRSITVHAAGGSLLLLLASLQLVTPIRQRYPRVHRWNGRLFMVVAVAVAVSGLFFGVLIPAAGAAEVVIIGAAGGWFLIAVARGFLAIRRMNVSSHRTWMIRAFAILPGIAAVRVVAAVADVVLTPRGWPLESIYVLSLVTGWGASIGAAEWWLRGERTAAAWSRRSTSPHASHHH